MPSVFCLYAIFFSVVPVSYTHLDVYKRQAVHDAEEVFWLRVDLLSEVRAASDRRFFIVVKSLSSAGRGIPKKISISH